MNPQDHKIFFLLDQINPHAIKTWIKRHQKIVDHAAQHYAFFASRRVIGFKRQLSATIVSNLRSQDDREYKDKKEK